MILRVLAVLVLSAVSAEAQIPYERIVDAAAAPGDWLTYSGTYASHRFSSLNQVDKRTVAQLRPAWIYQFQSVGIIETSPIVADGLMFVTELNGRVAALDARTGRAVWTYSPYAPASLIGFRFNRGVAVLDDTVFVGTTAAHLVALDAKSGVVRWDVVVEDNRRGYHITGAPLALEGRIIVGVAGGDHGTRGFLDAYDPKTGKRVWRLYTVPAGSGEPGAETWSGPGRKIGGATWVTGSFDPGLNLLYWGTGNPGPLWNGDERPGDNLYTCSLLAIDPKDGSIRWHFQYTPHDVHDWDSNQVPVLFDATLDGRARKLVALANRNGFYYVLDRENGAFVAGAPFVKQTWADGLDVKGRPILRPDAAPTKEGTLVFPGVGAAADWWSPTYSPQTELFYLAAGERGATYYKGEVDYRTANLYLGGGYRSVDNDDSWGAVRALEATTGKLKWEFRLTRPPVGGLLSTAGGLVFGGTTEGNFFALDADTGKPLWDFQLGAPIKANPMSFAVDGKQYVAIAARLGLFVFALP